MKNALYEFIDSFDDHSVITFCKNYEEFEQAGMIGDVPLRTVAQRWMAQCKIEHGVALWMDRVGFESFRVLVHRNNLLPK